MIKSKLISKAIFTDKSISTLNELVDYTGIESFAFMEQTHSNIVVNASKAGIFKSDGLLTYKSCLLYTSPSPRDGTSSRMPSSA